MEFHIETNTRGLCAVFCEGAQVTEWGTGMQAYADAIRLADEVDGTACDGDGEIEITKDGHIVNVTNQRK